MSTSYERISESRGSPLADSFAEHSAVLRRIVSVRVPAAHVDDVLQEVAVAAVGAGSLTIDSDQHLHWLCRVALTQSALFWRTHDRGHAVQAAAPDLLEFQAGMAADPCEWLIGQESHEQVREALNSLSAECRRLLVKKIIEGKTYRQIAEDESTSIDAIEYRLILAKRSLRLAIIRLQNTDLHTEPQV